MLIILTFIIIIQGGSGHALIYEGKLVGVSTFGASDNMPDVHTDAMQMREYLDEVINY